MVTVAQRQSVVSWEEQTRHPTIIIATPGNELYVTYRQARRIERLLRELLERIDEEREWL